MKSISILGTGAMGSRFALNLLRAGYDVTVWNRTLASAEKLRARGAAVAETPAAAATGADAVISLLRDDDAARAVWLQPERGACIGLGDGAVALECSSTTPDWSLELRQAVTACGADYLEAPLIGSRPQAEARQLIHLAGGEAGVLARVRPLLETGAAGIYHVGAAGAAMSAKLAVNMLFASQVAALAEALGVLARAGLNHDDALPLLAELPITSPALKGIGALIAARDFAPLFPIDLVAKDLDYYRHMAVRGGADSPLSKSARDVYVAAQAAGMGGDNIAAIARRYL